MAYQGGDGDWQNLSNCSRLRRASAPLTFRSQLNIGWRLSCHLAAFSSIKNTSASHLLTGLLQGKFKLQNQANLKKSKSPFVRKSERVGERKRYELHHLKRIKDDGAVYDVDNIRVMTPKRHIDIQKGDK